VCGDDGKIGPRTRPMDEADLVANEKQSSSNGSFTGMMLLPQVHFQKLTREVERPCSIMRRAEAISIHPRGIKFDTPA